MEIIDLKPKRLWTYFDEICKIPHTTFNLEQINHYLVNQFQQLGYKPILDKYGNIYVEKQASEGCENIPIVCLQAHSDMVGAKDEHSSHDFKKDPIQPIIDNGWIKANKTSLGADDGIGVAMILAIFSDKTLKHGPLEALITADEEQGMIGISKFDLSMLKAKYLINIDSENDEEVYIGCLGYAILTSKISFNTQNEQRKDTIDLNISFSGGIGGHSGVNIAEKRINAIKEIFCVLNFIALKYDIRLIDIERSGLAINVIPSQCSANINVLQKDVEGITQIINHELEMLKQEYELEKNINFTINQTTTQKKPMTKDDTMKIISLFSTAPNGVFTFNWQYNISETSSNLGTIETKDNEILASFMFRSCYDQAFARIINQFTLLFETFDGSIEVNSCISGWLPKPNAFANAYVDYYYKNICTKELKQVLSPGAFECAYILSKRLDIVGISIGPLMCDVHSQSERLNIDATVNVFNTLTGFLPTIK